MGRDAILQSIRTRLGVDASGARAAPVRAHIAAHARSPQPAPHGEPLAAFRARVLQLASTVDAVATDQDACAAVARYLDGVGLPREVVCWPDVATLSWQQAGIAAIPRVANGHDAVGVTGSFCAIAETGTIVLLSGPGTPGSVSLLPETHVALVHAHRVVPTMEDAWSLIRAERGALPRAVNFVSGPSRTADIEQTVTLGAHGPARVHIILIG